MKVLVKESLKSYSLSNDYVSVIGIVTSEVRHVKAFDDLSALRDLYLQLDTITPRNGYDVNQVLGQILLNDFNQAIGKHLILLLNSETVETIDQNLITRLKNKNVFITVIAIGSAADSELLKETATSPEGGQQVGIDEIPNALPTVTGNTGTASGRYLSLKFTNVTFELLGKTKKVYI